MINVLETKMSQVAEKFRQIEVEISAKKGDFNLFALIERDDSLGKWDVIASAKWINNQEKALINTIASKVSKTLTQEEQLMLSRIVILPPTDPFVRNLNMINVEHGVIKLSNNTFNGILIKEAYLITSKSQ
jgi:hypothetical protein